MPAPPSGVINSLKRSHRAEVSAMPADRIATVPPVPEEKATGKVAAIYADIKRTKNLDSVPNFWRVLATNPDHLEWSGRA